MDAQTRTCKLCGETKPINAFRHYYGGRKGYYTFCKKCEQLESRRRYLLRKGAETLSDAEKLFLDKLNRLYDMRVADGLADPRIPANATDGTMSLVDELLKGYENRGQQDM